jgi:hypothetical protein
MHKDYWSALGVSMPTDGQPLQNLTEFLTRQDKADDISGIFLNDEIAKRTYEGRWYLEDEPKLKAWIESQKKPLETAYRASLLPHYYSPLLARNAATGKPDVLIGASLGNIQVLREITSALVLRVRFQIRAKEFEAAWADTMTLYRLAALISQSGSYIQRLVAVAAHQQTGAATLEILDAAGWDRVTLQQKRAEWEKLPAWKPFSEVVDCERYTQLGVLQFLRQSTTNIDGQQSGAEERYLMRRVDWTAVFTRFNKHSDELLRIAKLEDRAQQQAESAATEVKLKQSRLVPEIGGALGYVTHPSEKYGNLLMTTLAPAFVKLMEAEHRHGASRESIRVAFALAEHRLDHGRYPDKLDLLVPEYLKAVPLDPYRLPEPLIYRRTETGYALYSVGPNRVDNGGPRAVTPTDKPNVGYEVPLAPITAGPPPEPMDRNEE